MIYRMQSPMLHRQPIDFIKRRQLSASLGASVSNVQPLEESVESGMKYMYLYMIMTCIIILLSVAI